MSLIQTHDLGKTYNPNTIPVEAVKHVDLQIEKKEFTAIVGPSGSGKTTLLNLVGGLDQPSYGNIVIDGTDIANLKSSRMVEYRLHHIGFVFQAYNLIPVFNAKENVEFIMLLQKISKSEREKKAVEFLKAVGLEDRVNSKPTQLSGGQQQRVAVSRAVVAKPKLILADEPTGNLDSKNSEEVMDILTKLNEAGTTIVMVTHSPHDAEYSHRIIHLFDGQVVTENIKEGYHV